LRIRLVKIGTGVHTRDIEPENQIAYHLVKLMRFMNADVITEATEHEAIIVAQLLAGGRIRYSSEDDRYHINGCSYTERDPERDVAICYPTWTEGHTEHVFFGVPTMFPSPHFEPDPDDYQRYVFSSTGDTPVMTKEVDFR
jgi:hypothetical protein